MADFIKDVQLDFPIIGIAMFKLTWIKFCHVCAYTRLKLYIKAVPIIFTRTARFICIEI